jgi:hypothetical protein
MSPFTGPSTSFGQCLVCCACVLLDTPQQATRLQTSYSAAACTTTPASLNPACPCLLLPSSSLTHPCF